MTESTEISSYVKQLGKDRDISKNVDIFREMCYTVSDLSCRNLSDSLESERRAANEMS